MLATVIITICIAAVVAWIIWSMIRKKKKGGGGSCGCGCSSCAMSDMCHKN